MRWGIKYPAIVNLDYLILTYLLTTMTIIHKLVGSDVTTLSICVGSYCITITLAS